MSGSWQRTCSSAPAAAVAACPPHVAEVACAPCCGSCCTADGCCRAGAIAGRAGCRACMHARKEGHADVTKPLAPASMQHTCRRCAWGCVPAPCCGCGGARGCGACPPPASAAAVVNDLDPCHCASPCFCCGSCKSHFGGVGGQPQRSARKPPLIRRQPAAPHLSVVHHNIRASTAR